MPLHHFFWEGKERSVAMSRDENNQISFLFIDTDILEKVSARILLKSALGQRRYLNENEISSLREADNLLHCIEQSVGKFL